MTKYNKSDLPSYAENKENDISLPNEGLNANELSFANMIEAGYSYLEAYRTIFPAKCVGCTHNAVLLKASGLANKPKVMRHRKAMQKKLVQLSEDAGMWSFTESVNSLKKGLKQAENEHDRIEEGFRISYGIFESRMAESTDKLEGLYAELEELNNSKADDKKIEAKKSEIKKAEDSHIKILDKYSDVLKRRGMGMTTSKMVVDTVKELNAMHGFTGDNVVNETGSVLVMSDEDGDGIYE